MIVGWCFLELEFGSGGVYYDVLSSIFPNKVVVWVGGRLFCLRRSSFSLSLTVSALLEVTSGSLVRRAQSWLPFKSLCLCLVK